MATRASGTLRKPMGEPGALEKRIVPNPRYAGVKAVVASGFNQLRACEKWDQEKLNVRFRREENFRRMKAATLASLLAAGDSAKVEALVLDVRDPEAHAMAKVVGSGSYPAPHLSRCFNPFTPELLAYSNKEPARIIIIYDYDERVAVPAANLFFEKGVDNVFLLSGGIRALAASHPDLVEGSLPAPSRPASPAASLASSFRSTASRAGGATTPRPSSARSMRSVRSSASTIPSVWR